MTFYQRLHTQGFYLTSIISLKIKTEKGSILIQQVKGHFAGVSVSKLLTYYNISKIDLRYNICKR